MKLAFCLFNYFPYGGMQRDFMRIAKACLARGHEVHVYTMSWEGDREHDMQIHLLPVKAWQNHARIGRYIHQLKQELKKQQFDCIIGFNKMPGLDVYYAADICYQARARQKHSFLYRLLPRYRQLVSLEKSVFDKANKTAILLISPKQQSHYQLHYQTESRRFHLLPPGIAKDRIAKENAEKTRDKMRHDLQLPPDTSCLLMLGSGFKTKGLDRVIKGLAALPKEQKVKTCLLIAGQDRASAFEKQADRLGVRNHIHFLGGRSDVPELLLAADLLVHPAYHENTGTVLLEAIAAGLPVLTVDVCGYAPYVSQAQAGVVLGSPFQQSLFNKILYDMLVSKQREAWKKNGIRFASEADIYSLPEKAASMIELLGAKDHAVS